MCPQNVLGKPVMMRIAPSTPKAGSIFVSKNVLSADGASVADAEADEEEDVAVTLTLKTELETKVVWMVSSPERVRVVIVVTLVVRDSETPEVLDASADRVRVPD